MFLEIYTQIHSVVFALSRQINKQKYVKTINLIWAGNKINLRNNIFCQSTIAQKSADEFWLSTREIYPM